MTSPWQYFTLDELSCRGENCCEHQMLMDPGFMQKIVRIRRLLGFPFAVTSAYRCPLHNSKVSHTGENGPHTTGHAIDIACWSDDAFLIVKAAMDAGVFTGIGVNQRGNQRFVHLDDIKRERRRMWSY